MKKNFYSVSKLFLVLTIALSFKDAKSQAPVANFNVCKTFIEQYEIAQMQDLSTNMPTTWEWKVYDSITYANDPNYGPVVDLNSGYIASDPLQNGNNEFSANPEFQFDLPGCYTVVLKAMNANGSSTIVKQCLIKVTKPYKIFLGFGSYDGLNFNYGKIYDNGGENMNYTNSQGVSTLSNVKILPTNGRNITINFKQIRLADAGDYLTIYDSDTVTSNILGVITNSNNGQNLTFSTTQSSMYITFVSNSSGVDSGYIAEFYTDYNPFELNKDINIVRNLVNAQSVFTNKNQEDFIKNYTRKWYVNNNLQSSFTDKDTLKYTFTNTNAYQVCLEISNCDTTFQTCITDSNDICEALFSIFPDSTTTYSGIIQDLSTASTTANYLWEFGDGDTSTSRTPTHTYAGQGPYNLCLTVSESSCISQYCDSLGFDTSGNLIAAMKPFSIKIVDKNGNSSNINLISLTQLKYYPNPVQNYLTIENFDFINNKLEVYDIMGQKVIGNISSETIDFTLLSSGVYILKISSPNGHSEAFRIIKY